MEVTNFSGYNIGKCRIFFKSNLPVWPENCWIKYLAQVFPEPGADAIAVRGPKVLLKINNYLDIFLFFELFTTSNTQFWNHKS